MDSIITTTPTDTNYNQEEGEEETLPLVIYTCGRGY
jgi:hypothetical protein